MRLRGIIAALRFSNPLPSEVAILYPEDYWIRTLILKDVQSTTIELLPRSLHLTPLLLARMLLRLSKVKWLDFQTENYRKNLFRQLYAQYILACIDQVGAKVVLSNIDNSSFFQYLSRLDSGRTYFAIQNGARTLYCVRDSLPRPPHSFSRISMTNFFCFGQRDVKLFSQFGHKIDTYFPVGSLVGGYFQSNVSTGASEKKYDLCLISQWDRRFFQELLDDRVDYFRRVGRGLSEFYLLFSTFVEETGLNLIICPRHTESDSADMYLAEIAFYKELFGAQVAIDTPDRKNFSTYRAIEQSELAIALNSTTLSEVFAWGQKVLWCNPTCDERFQMPEAGISYFSGNDYQAFKARVLTIINMLPDEYIEKTKSDASFICRYDRNFPAHELIRSSVLKSIGLSS